VSQFPRAEIDPLILIVCPIAVVTFSSNVTATEVAVAQAVELVVVVVAVVVDFELVDPDK
jgi:hypothetical protein